MRNNSLFAFHLPNLKYSLNAVSMKFDNLYFEIKFCACNLLCIEICKLCLVNYCYKSQFSF